MEESDSVSDLPLDKRTTEKLSALLSALEVVVDIGTLMMKSRPAVRLVLVATHAAIRAVRATLNRKELYIAVDNTTKETSSDVIQ